MQTTSSVPVSRFRDVLQAQFGGRLSVGCHEPHDGKASPIEAVAAARGLLWTDNPHDVGIPDVRPLSNGGPWSSDESMTGAVAPVVEALWGWSGWPEARRRAWSHEVVLRTIREILPAIARAFGAASAADLCARADTLDACARAAWWAGSDVATEGPALKAARAARAAAQATDAEQAAWHAACAASYAARAFSELGRPDAADETLRTACRIWREAAESFAR